MLSRWNGLSRALIVTVLVATGLLAGVGPAVADQAPAPKVADPCSLLKPAEVKAALRKAPKSLRPLRVNAGVSVTSPTTEPSTYQSCALGLLLRKNVGGSIQLLASPTAEGRVSAEGGEAP